MLKTSMKIGLALAVAAALMVPSTSAFASAQTGSAAGLPIDLGPSPTGVGNCTFANGDANFVFLSGTTVQHESINKNGDWGGNTAEGTAVFYEGTTALYQGHLTVWGGGGNNATLQTENGFTLSFTGTGPGGTLTIHVVAHATTNAAGTQTSNVGNVTVSCS